MENPETLPTKDEPETTVKDENLEIDDDENSNEDLELKQLEEELNQNNQKIDTQTGTTTNQPENNDVKAKLERLRLLRQKKKERKRAKKLQEKPEDPALQKILSELESSFDGKEFQVLIKVLQPAVMDLKERFYIIRNDLRLALTRYYPQVDIKLFGSCVTDLIFENSDFDFFVDVPTNEDNLSKLNRVHRLICNSKAFVRPIKISRARTPLIKVIHAKTKTQMDINVSNPMGVFNSEFLRFALSFDPRIKPLAICIKYWARIHHISGTNNMSNYCLVNLVLFYLMNIRDPLFPEVCILQQRVPEYFIGPWNLAFDAHFPNTTKCMLSLIELLEGFFQYYANFSFEDVVVCVYSGKAYPRRAFEEPRSLIEEVARYHIARRRFDVLPLTLTTPVCVQDPFEMNVNIGNSINANTFARFREYCLLGVKIFHEFPSETSRASIILKKLFTMAPAVTPSVSSISKVSSAAASTSQQICKLTPMQHEMTVFNRIFDMQKKEDTEFNRKRFWCDQVVDQIEKMLHDVYLVSLFPFELKRSTLLGYVTLFDKQIRLRANTWTNRPTLVFTDKEGLEKEIALSKEMKEKSPKIQMDAEITIQAKRERDFIEITLVELTGKEENRKLLQEFFEGTILTSLRSFVKSYSNILLAEEKDKEEIEEKEKAEETNEERNKEENMEENHQGQEIIEEEIKPETET